MGNFKYLKRNYGPNAINNVLAMTKTPHQDQQQQQEEQQQQSKLRVFLFLRGIVSYANIQPSEILMLDECFE